MNLKHDIEKYPNMWRKEIVDALENYKNGEISSKRKLRKFVSEYYYNELVKRYDYMYRINKAKKDRERSKKIKSVLCIIFAIAVLISSTESSLDYLIVKYSAESAVLYFFLYLWAIFYAFATDPNSKQFKKLERENKILKLQLEKLQENAHQE